MILKLDGYSIEWTRNDSVMHCSVMDIRDIKIRPYKNSHSKP